jgi:hypothetical protein
MRGNRWLQIGQLGLGSCLLAGCLRAALPTEAQQTQSGVSARAVQVSAEQTSVGHSRSECPPDSRSESARAEKPPSPPSDYQVSRTLAVPPTVQPALATVKAVDGPAEKPAQKLVEPVEMRIRSEESPAHPPEPPPHLEVHPAPLTRPDAPSVQVLRGLLDHHPEEEINEQLKPYDPATREVLLLLLSSVVQLEQDGGIARIAPRDLAAWTSRLNTLTASLHSRSQLILERTCFCSSINNFGDFAPLPAEHSFFHPGELAHVYVQARNLSSRRRGEKYATVLKARLEIFDENSREKPPISWASVPREDISASPRQDYYINFRFQVPPSCPAGLYTLRITVEDWTDAPPGAKQVPPWRIARCTLDFRVGGPIARPARNRLSEAASQP